MIDYPSGRRLRLRVDADGTVITWATDAILSVRADLVWWTTAVESIQIQTIFAGVLSAAVSTHRVGALLPSLTAHAAARRTTVVRAADAPSFVVRVPAVLGFRTARGAAANSCWTTCRPATVVAALAARSITAGFTLPGTARASGRLACISTVRVVAETVRATAG